jgi:hypothetical protein
MTTTTITVMGAILTIIDTALITHVIHSILIK